MNQIILLIRTYRRKLLQNSAGFLILSPIALLFMIFPLSLTDFYRTGTGTEPLSTIEILLDVLSKHIFIGTITLAAAASHLQPIARFQRALVKLPVPVTPRQLAYLPLATTLAHWAAAQLLLHGALLIGWLLTGHGNPIDAALGALAALPLGLLYTLVTGRNSLNTGHASQGSVLFVVWMGIPTLDDATKTSIMSAAQSTYPYLLVVIIPVVIIMLWEMPLHVQRFYRAIITVNATPLVEVTQREPMAPQRFRWSSLVVDAVSFVFECLGNVSIVLYFVVIFTSLSSSDEAERMPLWLEQSLYGLAYAFVFLAVMYFVGKQAILLMQRNQINTRSFWAQGLLRITYLLQRGPSLRRMPSKETISYSNVGQRYLFQFERANSEATQSEEPPADRIPLPGSLKLRSMAVTFVLCTAIFSLGIGNNKVNWDRAGSGIQDAPMPGSESPYEINGTYSQHYVTLSLAAKPAVIDRYAFYEATQAVAARIADPSSWLDGLTTLDGSPPTVPDKYRIEIAWPEPDKMVIQGIGLHWAPAGHLAYALGRHIETLLEKDFDIALAPDYWYHRPYEAYRQAYAFLDNKIHWIPPEGANTDSVNVAAAPAPTDRPVFVDARNTGWRKNGKSWATAYTTIQEGINAAYRRRIASVWVAGGTYDNIRFGDGALYLKLGIHVYGGFSGNETSRTQRDLPGNPTHIDGSRARDGEPAYHVVVGAHNSALDGFTITGGVADGHDYLEDSGGGLLVEDCSMSVANCIFLENEASEDGGAINVTEGVLDIARCEFRQNRSFDYGGALSLPLGSSVVVRDSIFSKNTAKTYGSAIGLIGESLSLENCLFAKNATRDLYGTLIWGSNFSMANCTVVGTGAEEERLLVGTSSETVITNTIICNLGVNFSDAETTVNHSILPGAAPGVGNQVSDPLFVDAKNGDYRLRPDSPAIDAGNSKDASALDLDGNPRVQGSAVDMGAYEFVPQ